MDYVLVALKFGFLTFSLVYGGRYITCVIWQKTVGEVHAWLMGVSISGFVTLQWLLS